MGGKNAPDLYESGKTPAFQSENSELKTAVNNKKSDRKNVHEGHRKRLRERFLREGLDGFEDHNALELLLFNSIPQKDTNVEAHRLLDTFGSFPAVFDAEYEDLCKVQGVGPKTAALIKLMPALFRKYEVAKLNSDYEVLNTASLAAEFASKYFKGVTVEKLYALYLDANCRKLSFEEISSGSVCSTPLNNRLIAKYAYDTNAASVILIHNHPSGISAPSRKDVDVTVQVADVLAAVGIRLSDHIILGNGSDYFSFRKSEKWKYIFK